MSFTINSQCPSVQAGGIDVDTKYSTIQYNLCLRWFTPFHILSHGDASEIYKTSCMLCLHVNR